MGQREWLEMSGSLKDQVGMCVIIYDGCIMYMCMYIETWKVMHGWGEGRGRGMGLVLVH